MTSRNNHAPRDTSTGKVNEADIEQFLSENFNHSVYPQAELGTQFSTGKTHIVDVLLGGSAYKKKKTAKRWISQHQGGTLISLKYQKVEGTAEEKIPFEFWKLQDAINKYGYKKAIIVLCGNEGWTLKEEYLSEEFKAQMKIIYPDVTITDEENFRAEITS
tara:strand:- start:51 stop:533 length:483 start_codon:yes stop_codon:yes gene_type:complete